MFSSVPKARGTPTRHFCCGSSSQKTSVLLSLSLSPSSLKGCFGEERGLGFLFLPPPLISIFFPLGKLYLDWQFSARHQITQDTKDIKHEGNFQIIEV